MGDRIRQSFQKLKSFWGALSKKIKAIIFAILVIILIVAIVLVAVINANRVVYTAVFPNMTLSEANEVESAVKGMGVETRRGAEGQVMVPEEMYPKVAAELSMRGYPKTPLTYDVFQQASGLTSTDFEKRQAYVFQLQNRLQETINQYQGVANNIVTLNIQQENVRVWEVTDTTNSASVSLRLEPGYTMQPQQVSGIKWLVATSVPNMKTENVKVIDAATSISLRSAEDNDTSAFAALERMELERKMAQRMEEQAMNVLTVVLKPEQVRVSAFVALDYDKMVRESKQYVPSEQSTNNSGVLQRYNRQQTTNRLNPADGIPGEEDNTDLPTYVDQLADDTNAVDFAENMEYAVSYILEQIEKDTASVKDKSIAVSIYSDIDDYTRQSMIASVSKATGVPEENVSIENYVPLEEETPPTNPMVPFKLTRTQWIIIIGAAVLLLIIIIIIMLIIASINRKKREQELQEAAQAEILELTESDAEFNLQQELEERKRALREGNMKTADDAIADEVREFARNNPEITANLLRAWMREEIE